MPWKRIHGILIAKNVRRTHSIRSDSYYLSARIITAERELN
jgi:hypothetical protein